MDYKRPTSDEDRALVGSIPTSIPLKADIDVEEFRSIDEATDNTHIQVNTTPVQVQENNLFFDIKESALNDAREFQQNNEEHLRLEEQKQLKKDNQHVINCSPEEKKAIVSLIIKSNPECVFDALMYYHQLLDGNMKNASLVEVSKWENHEKKYNELFSDLKEDTNALKEHLRTFSEWANF